MEKLTDIHLNLFNIGNNGTSCTPHTEGNTANVYLALIMNIGPWTDKYTEGCPAK